ncbi:hypothetical protein LG324_04660 [Phycicoccus jejuensis]|uniref:hypothetical protein n=1 Tax=Phycicoccus jejuensis TaxID=367299 RepID=UPI00384ABA83
MSDIDRRSVGELLLEADSTARTILVDVAEMDAATMLRTWGEVVQAASELWQALPASGPVGDEALARPDASDLTILRLDSMSRAQHRSGARGWPGDGPADDRHLRIAESFARAEGLVERYASRKHPPVTARALADRDAARVRIMHTLYVGAHGVAVALAAHVRALEKVHAARRAIPAGESLRQARTAYKRIAAFERVAGAYVAQTYPGALAGEHRAPPIANRLADALARWDVAAHRSLVNTPRTSELMLTARTQAVILSGSDALLHAASQTGHIDTAQHRRRLETAIATTQDRWETLAATLATLAPPLERRADRALTAASLEVRAALREILVDGNRAATADVVGQRTDLSRLPDLVGQALAANLELAHVTRDAMTDERLTGGARGIHEIATAARRASLDPRILDHSPHSVDITPQDLLANRAVPLLPVVWAELSKAADAATDAAATAMSAGAPLTGRVVSQTPATDQPKSLGRETAERSFAVGIAQGPAGPRCER